MGKDSFIVSLESGLQQAVDAVCKGNRILSLSDLFVYVDTDEESISFYDDAEMLLSSTRCKEGFSHYYHKKGLQRLKEFFASSYALEMIVRMDILKPFSVVLVSRDFTPEEDLLLLDDDNLLLNNDLLNKYDKELDEFLQKLLS